MAKDYVKFHESFVVYFLVTVSKSKRSNTNQPTQGATFQVRSVFTTLC